MIRLEPGYPRMLLCAGALLVAASVAWADTILPSDNDWPQVWLTPSGDAFPAPFRFRPDGLRPGDLPVAMDPRAGVTPPGPSSINPDFTLGPSRALAAFFNAQAAARTLAAAADSESDSDLAATSALSPTDFITRLILQVLQARQSLIPSTITINHVVTLMGTSITIKSLTFTQPRVNAVTLYSLDTPARGVFDLSVGASGTFPNAQLHVSMDAVGDEAVDLGSLVLFVNGTDTGLTLPCADVSQDVQLGRLAIPGIHLTSTSSDPIVTLLTGVINANSAILNTILSGVTNKVVPSHFPLPPDLGPIIGIVCGVGPSPDEDAQAMAAHAAGNLEPVDFLTQIINGIIKSNPTVALDSCRSSLNSLNLCGKVSSSNSWGGLNDACRVGCQIPCQTEFGLCKVGWAACKAVCWLGCSCPNCGAIRDRCLRACDGTCHYDLHANVAVRTVGGLGGVTVSRLTIDPAHRTFFATLAIPKLRVQLAVDVSLIPTITSTENINPLQVNATFTYSCPSSGTISLSLDTLHGSPFDVDSIFKFFHSTVGEIPLGLGDKFDKWLLSKQQRITDLITGALQRALNNAISKPVAVPGGLNLCPSTVPPWIRPRPPRPPVNIRP